MTCPNTAPLPHFKNILAVLVLCLVTTTQQVQAVSKEPYVLVGTVVLWYGFTMLGIYEFKNKPEPFSESMELMPRITYEIDNSNSHIHGATKVVLKPKIIRGQYIKPHYWDMHVSNFIERVVCGPISKTSNPGLNFIAISDQCHEWFKTHTMVFPHQALGIKVDALDTLLLPELVFDTNSHKLELMAAHVSFVDEEGRPSSANSEVTNKKDVHWQQLSPSFPDLNALKDIKDHPFELCHHVPEWARMQEPTTDHNGLIYYQFPIPGISHMHRSGAEFYIVSQKKVDEFTGYYWTIDAPWPSGYQTLQFSKVDASTKPVTH